MVFKFDKQFLNFFDKAFIVGVSGGADSVFLLYQIIRYFQDKKKNTNLITVVTCNHGIRSTSESDCSFVKNICDEYGIECMSPTLNPSPKQGGKSEKTLRLRRHQQFLRIAKEKGAKTLFLGHNLTDRFETTLLNMGRGCGLSGLLSIRPIDDYFLDQTLKVVRPLIFLPKDQIFKYCENLGVEYVSDSTNFDSKVSKRNFVRNNIFPFFQQISNKKTDGKLKFRDSVLTFYENLEQTPTIPLISDCLKLSEQAERKISGNTNQISSLDKGRLGGVCLKPINLIPERESERGYEVVKNETVGSSACRDRQKNIKTYLLGSQGRQESLFFVNDLIEIAKKLHFYQNVSKNVLEEIINFLNNSKSGYKHRNGIRFFVSHGKRYIISVKSGKGKVNLVKSGKGKAEILSDFFVETNNNPSKIESLTKNIKKRLFWHRNSNGKDLILDSLLQGNDKIMRYPKDGDTFKGKTLNKYLINKKVPIFYRPWVRVYEKDEKIVSVDCDFFK